MSRPARVLIAGVGNVLRGDDGFGPAVVQELEKARPEGVDVIEVGIGGVGMIHELMEGYDGLVIVDAVDREGEPGSLYVLEPEVPGSEEIAAARRGKMADVHQLMPGRILVLARALGILPSFVRIVGCKPLETDELTTDLSPCVRDAVPRALSIVHRLVEGLTDGEGAPDGRR